MLAHRDALVPVMCFGVSDDIADPFARMHGNAFVQQLLRCQRGSCCHGVFLWRATERLLNDQLGQRDFAAFQFGNALRQHSGCLTLPVAQFLQRIDLRNESEQFLLYGSDEWRRIVAAMARPRASAISLRCAR